MAPPPIYSGTAHSFQDICFCSVAGADLGDMEARQEPLYKRLNGLAFCHLPLSLMVMGLRDRDELRVRWAGCCRCGHCRLRLAGVAYSQPRQAGRQGREQ